jgi:hypothetical protein
MPTLLEATRDTRLRCGAETAAGTPCQRPAVRGGPCAWHDPRRTPEPRVWPLPRRWRLMELIERGWPDARIGDVLGCSAIAVKLARRRYGIAPKSRAILTAREVAKRLGIRCAKTVAWWIASGWLSGQRGWAVGKNRAWMVREEALLGFLADPAHFHRWQPERITDRGLREWAMAQRGDVRFLTLGGAAAWLCQTRSICVERGTVAQWIAKGWLPAVRNGNHLVRQDDLATFQRPVFGQGARKRSWAPCAQCGAPNGGIKRHCVTPARRRAARYGVEGLVCRECYERVRRQFLREHQAAAYEIPVSYEVL